MNINEKEFEILLFEFYKQVGKNVKKARSSKNMSQLQLSQQLNYKSVSSISNCEICYKNHHFSLSQLYKISIVLDTKLEELIKID